MSKKQKTETNLFFLTGQDDGKDPIGWYGLPDCTQEENEAEYILQVKIVGKDNLDQFADLLDQPLLKKDSKLMTKSIWYPQLIMGERGSNKEFIWVDESMVPNL